MKKLTAIFAALLLVFSSTAAIAANDRPITVAQLPASAQQFITKYFNGVQVSYAKVDDDWFGKSYDVVFANGCKAEFAKDGSWTEVDCKYAALPEGIVPAQIKAYAAKNHAGTKIVSIERDKRGYEIRLDNKLELKFDNKFNCVEIDD